MSKRNVLFLWIVFCFLCIFGGSEGCQYDISLPAGELVHSDGGAGAERGRELLVEPATTEPVATEPLIVPEKTQLPEPTQDDGCRKEVACLRCSTAVAVDERMILISDTLLVLEGPKGHALINLVDCRRRALSPQKGGVLQVAQTSSGRGVLFSRYPLLLEILPPSSPEGLRVLQMTWIKAFDASQTFDIPAGWSLLQTASAPFVQGRGLLEFIDKQASGEILHHAVYFDGERGTFSKDFVSTAWQTRGAILSPFKDVDLLFFKEDSGVVHVATWDLVQQKILSKAPLEKSWLREHIKFGVKRFLIAESSKDAAGQILWTLKLFSHDRLQTPITSISLSSRSFLSFAAWFDPTENVFWVLLGTTVRKIKAETGEVEEASLPSSLLVRQWLGPRYGQMWVLTVPGGLSGIRFEGGILKERALTEPYDFFLLGTCNPSSSSSTGRQPYFQVLRGASKDGPQKTALVTLAFDKNGARLAEAGQTISPAIMGRMTEFLQCYDGGFLFFSDSGQKFEITASFYGVSRPFWQSEASLLELPPLGGGTGALHRMGLVTLSNLREQSTKLARWSLLDFARGKTQEEEVSIDASAFTPWGATSDAFVVLREALEGKHRLLVYRVR